VDPYQLAFHWVRRRLLDEPGTALTTRQLHRASGVAPRTCRQVLLDLARSGFLVASGGDTFTRPDRPLRHPSPGPAHGGS
jgi:DNA-binding GntR family transcriptional regulator